MDLKELRPGYLYGFLQSVTFENPDSEQCFCQSFESQENGEVSEFAKEELEAVVDIINEELLVGNEIDPKYIFEKAPKDYFINIGKKLIRDSYDFMSVVCDKFVKVFERIHDKKANNFRYALGFGMYIENDNPAVAECLPFPFAGCYSVRKYGHLVYPFLIHMGLDLLELTDDYQTILSLTMEKSVCNYVQEYIDINGVYRFGHAVNQIKFLEYEYDPIKVENAPAGKEKYFQRRIEEMKDDYFARKAMKIVAKINPVFGDNFWIPGDDEE